MCRLGRRGRAREGGAEGDAAFGRSRRAADVSRSVPKVKRASDGLRAPSSTVALEGSRCASGHYATYSLIELTNRAIRRGHALCA